MRVSLVLRVALVSAAALPVASAAAQSCGVRFLTQGGISGGTIQSSRSGGAVIGVTTSSGSTVRDTLGVLVSSVNVGSPAEKAGIEEGNRIAAVNGVSLRLAAPDVGDDAMAGIMSRRLCRELDKIKPGDDVDLRVYANGQTKSIKVKAVDSDELYRSRIRTSLDDRPTIGVSLATTGSIRDTLGVFVMSVDDGGPAAKAGIEEGNRIAAVNGVDVRARRGEEDEWLTRTTSINRLQREIQRARVGDDVELRVYSGGQYRNVKVKVGRAADLPTRKRGGAMVIGPDRVVMSSPANVRVDIDGARIGDEVRRAVELGLDGAGRGIATAGRVLEGFGLGLRNRISW
jgi:S1-C subfamily serine protease